MLPVVEKLRDITPVPVSVDTYRASVAKSCLEAGASVINDVWGLRREPEIARVAAHYGGACGGHAQSGRNRIFHGHHGCHEKNSLKKPWRLPIRLGFVRKI